MDPTPEEECCSSSGIVVAVSGEKKITAVRKIGSGSLHSESLVSMLKVGLQIKIREGSQISEILKFSFLSQKTGSEVGAVVNKILMSKLVEEEKLDKSQKFGFLR